VIGVPAGPEVGFKVVMFGVGNTVKSAPLLATPPTVTITSPVVAFAGIVAKMLLTLQVIGVAGVPLSVTVLVPCDAPKFVPMIVIDVPTAPEAGTSPVIVGRMTAKLTLLLARPPTVTTTFPVVAPAGTDTAILLGLQPVGVATVPLNVT